MPTREAFEQWLDDYLRPQQQRSAEKIKELFTDDATYSYGPYFEPRVGIDAIYNHHKNALAHQDDLDYTWKVLAVTDEYGVAHFHLTLTDHVEGEPNTYDGVFLVYLIRDGRCTRFEEWWHAHTR
jgi:hypothetical protein